MGSWLGIGNRSLFPAAAAATPTYSPGSGTYSSAQTVAISCANPGAAIYYTTDGSTPTFPISGTTAPYSAPISVSGNQTINAIALVAGFLTSAVASAAYVISTSNFFADPYSTFANIIADTTFGGTPGATTSVSWNGGTISGPTYSTLQAAINALLTAGPGSSGRRVCALLNQSMNVSAAPITFPGSTAAFSAALPFVVQGDPIATQTEMPTVTGAGAGATCFAIGDALSGSGGQFNKNIVIRKFNMGNITNPNGNLGVDGASGVHFGDVAGGSFGGCIVEFCNIQTFRATGSAGESGPIYCNSINSSEPLTIRFNKLGDVQLPGGGQNDNHSCVGLYGSVIQIYNNEMSQCTNGVRFKGCSPTTPNGSQVYNNFIHDCARGIYTASGNEGPDVNQIPFYNNLFGWQNLNNSLWQSGAYAFNDFGAGGGTTTPKLTQFYNNTVTQGWQGGFLNCVTQQCSVYNNVILCGGTLVACSENGSAGSITFLDYNAYFTGNWVQNNEGSPQYNYTTFASWQAAFTTNAYHDLTANPDAHGIFIPNLSSSYNTILKLFPNSGAGDYTNAPGSPLIGAGQSGANMGCNMATVGPGW